MKLKSHIHAWKKLGNAPEGDGIVVGCDDKDCYALFGLTNQEGKLFDKAKSDNKKRISITDEHGKVHIGR